MLKTTTTLDLTPGPVTVHDWGGGGEPVLLVHGLLVDHRLWDAVAPLLAEQGLRVVVPDLPLGAHAVPMHEDADLSPRAIAVLLGEITEAMALDGVTLVGNDTGGAICQIAAATRPGWLARLVLTPCDTHENFLPPLFSPLLWLARNAPWALTGVMQAMRVRAMRRTPLFLGWLAKTRVPDEVTDAWLDGFLHSPAIRRDVMKTLRAIDRADTLRAAQDLHAFDRPALIAWAPEDRFFPWRLAERLAGDIPGARLERIEDSYAFTPIDQPQRTAELIAAFVRETPRSGPTAGVPLQA